MFTVSSARKAMRPRCERGRVAVEAPGRERVVRARASVVQRPGQVACEAVARQGTHRPELREDHRDAAAYRRARAHRPRARKGTSRSSPAGRHPRQHVGAVMRDQCRGAVGRDETQRRQSVHVRRDEAIHGRDYACRRVAPHLGSGQGARVHSSSSSPGASMVPSRLRLTFILGALSAFAPMSIDMYLPSLPAIAREFGATTASAQLDAVGLLPRARDRPGALRPARRPLRSQAALVPRAHAVRAGECRLRSGDEHREPDRAALRAGPRRLRRCGHRAGRRPRPVRPAGLRHACCR